MRKLWTFKTVDTHIEIKNKKDFVKVCSLYGIDGDYWGKVKRLEIGQSLSNHTALQFTITRVN